MSALFNLDNAQAHHGSGVVLYDLNLTINEGEKVAIIGQSGSGKTTLLNLLFRQQAPSCGLIPQQLGLVSSLTVLHNTYMGRLDRQSWWYNLVNLVWPLPAVRQEIASLLEEVGLANKIQTAAGELSGGEQQRTALARVLYRNSDILIGDEPVSSLDEHQAERILDLIVSRHTTVILAMHNVSLALSHMDRIIGLRGGRIALDAPAQDLAPANLASIYQD